MYPETYKYTNDHEWIHVQGETGRIGITDYAQKQLGDIVFLDLPEVGKKVAKGEVLGSIESVNKDPHGSWMVVVKLSNPAELSSLLDAAKYSELAK